MATFKHDWGGGDISLLSLNEYEQRASVYLLWKAVHSALSYLSFVTLIWSVFVFLSEESI